MRLMTVRHHGTTRAARVDGDSVVLLESPDLGTLLTETSWRAAAGSRGEVVAREDTEAATLISASRKFIGVGLNYRSHIAESKLAAPAHPTLFAKFPRALIGARDPIVLPRASAEVDWEVELGVVIGSGGRHLDPHAAHLAIAGYTVVNDISARDWQRRTSQFLQGKTFEQTTPVGPVMVTGDEIDDARDLRLCCEVDGVCMQDARTSDLLFCPAALVAYISTVITLEPGDVIATGTPGGVGGARNPPIFLKPGQIVRSSIEGIGELVNLCVEEPA